MTNIFQRHYTRWKYSNNKIQTLLVICIWGGVFTIWSLRHIHGNQLHSADKTSVHDKIDDWHLSDSVVPKLFVEKEMKWSEYPQSAVYLWEEPDEPQSDPEAPGDMGEGVTLSGIKEKEAKLKSSIHQLNLVVSDMIPLNRSLPDHRNQR